MNSSRPWTAGRLRSGWTAAVLIALAVLAVWLPDLDLPLGDSDEGRILARFGLHARNFWEQGAAESGYGASIAPYIRGEYGVAPGEAPPREAVTYAHHPPLQTFVSVLSVGVFGDTVMGLRAAGFLMGAAAVLFMAALLRIRGIGWGPTLLAVGSMAVTGFYFVYGRIGVGFSLIVALAAAVAYLREAPDPPPAAAAGAAALAGLTAMQSWIAMAAAGLLVLWLLAARRWAPITLWTAAGALAGALVTAAWLLNSTDLGELGSTAAVRVDTAQGSFGDFLVRQWRFASMFTPVWFRVLAPFALLAGLIDRRTRVPAAVTLGVAAAWTFGLQQGAWVHLLWNFPWLAPITIGMAALIDAARRMPIGVQAARVAAGAGAAALAVSLYGVVTGPVRETHLTAPAAAGLVMEQAAQLPRPGLMWAAPGISSPRWVSYYLDEPVWRLDADSLDELGADDLVLVRTDRIPGYIPEESMDEALISEGRYRLIPGKALVR